MEPARFRYSRPDKGGEAEEESSAGQLQLGQEQGEVPCVLDIYVHHARGIHNICIYANQDVYAKFALTSAPDDAPALATRVAPGGGASPRFDERLPPLRVRRGRLAVDVLKCEVWMRSCAKRLLDDQLLGFALVPLAAVAAAHGASLAGDFELSSTDLFHSPAGTIRLSLALRSGLPGDACGPPPEPSIASEVVILEPAPPPVDDYSRIEFTDLKVEQENDAMAVQYLPFLHLHPGETRLPGAVVAEDCEMSGGASPRGERSASSEGSKNAAASTASTVSEDRAAISSSAEAAEKPRPDADEATTAPIMSCRSPDTPTSCGGKGAGADTEKGDVFKSPLGDIDMEAEQSAMQRQIMEMYMKSMQQFSQSLAKVKLPIELGADGGVVVQKEGKPDTDSSKVIEQQQQQQQVKKDGARVVLRKQSFLLNKRETEEHRLFLQTHRVRLCIHRAV